MKIWLIALTCIILLALFVAAVDFNPGGNIDLKGRYNVINGGNFTGQYLALTVAPSSCPANSYMTFWNGSVSTCTAFNSVNLNASTKNVTVQCLKFDSGGTICSS